MSAGMNRTVFCVCLLWSITVIWYPVTLESSGLSHVILHCDPTVVGCGLEGVAQPAVKSSEIMSNGSKDFAKLVGGFIECLQGSEAGAARG